MNVNGNNKDCKNCHASVELGVNYLGMSLYGCKNRQPACKDGNTILEQIEQARQERDKAIEKM
jgi:cytochrome c2